VGDGPAYLFQDVEPEATEPNADLSALLNA
jgi:hypothetical protein